MTIFDSLQGFHRFVAGELNELEVCPTVSDADTMFRHETPDAYFNVGRSGLRLCLTGTMARLGYYGGEAPIKTILDFGAGYGRVTRFLRAGFPNARIDVSDMDESGPDWCETHLDVHKIPSDQSLPPNTYDLIFLGSVFTHLRSETILKIIADLKISLKANGILIFSTQGRYSFANTQATPDKSYRLSIDSIKSLLSDYERDGFSYQDYAPERNYGITLINPSWMFVRMSSYSDLILASFQEKGFYNHQDAFTYVRSP